MSVAEALQGGTTATDLLELVKLVTSEAVGVFVVKLPRLRKKRALVRVSRGPSVCGDFR